MNTQRQRTEKLHTHVEVALTTPSTRLDSFADVARELRIIVAHDLTDDEIIMAACRVRTQWRQRRHIPGARPHLKVVEANWARWIPEKALAGE